MRALSFQIDGRGSYGLLDGGQVFAVTEDWRHRFEDLKSVLEASALHELPANVASEPVDEDRMDWLPPIPNPGKIICVGVNYRPHVEEMGRDVPAKPLLFVRFPSSIVGHRQPLIRPVVSEQFDFEGEVAIVIGRRASGVSRDASLEYVAGYTAFMDGTVRDWQRHTTQFTPGKNFTASGAMGPYLVSRDESGDELGIEPRLNGETMQSGHTGELIFDVPALIEYCSTFTVLEPGDIIATGTPGGVGAARKPPVWLKPGDRLEVAVEPLGVLENAVIEG